MFCTREPSEVAPALGFTAEHVHQPLEFRYLLLLGSFALLCLDLAFGVELIHQILVLVHVVFSLLQEVEMNLAVS